MGAKGDRFDLTMATLYFRGSVQSPIRYGERHALTRESLAIPLHVGHTIQRAPLVGTEAGYLEHRALTLAQGRPYALLGEVIAGSAVAERFDLQVGDTVRNDINRATNLAGAYPHQLRVVGVLDETGMPDDDALFTSLPTVWMLDGHLHGHEDVTAENAIDDSKDGDEDDEVLEATAAIFMIQEISDETRAAFHFHGEQDDLHVSGLVVPADQQRARYAPRRSRAQRRSSGRASHTRRKRSPRHSVGHATCAQPLLHPGGPFDRGLHGSSCRCRYACVRPNTD